MDNNRIKEVRKSKGITQAQLAKALGVTQGAIQFWENGEREPSLKILKKISEILNCEPWELLPMDMQPKITQKDLELIRLLKSMNTSTDTPNSSSTKVG